MFFQFKCEQTQKDLDTKFKDTQTIVMIEMFCVFLVYSYLLLAKRQTKVLAKHYSSANLKPSDYAMFLKLSPS